MIKASQPAFLTRRILLGGLFAGLPVSQVLAQSRGARPDFILQPALGPLPESWRQAEVLEVWPGSPPNGGFEAQALPADFPEGFFRNVARPTLHVFRPRTPNGAAILVIPGGAYTFVVGTHEGAATAEAFADLGYTVFVLVYRLPGEGWTGRSDVPLQDAQRSLRLMRANALRFGFDRDRIAALGYSAGGHLAASLATGFDEPVYAAVDASDTLDARPSAVALIYPVITLTAPETNPQTALSLLGADPDPALVARRSPDEHVRSTTPPAFMVHALDDSAVPPANTLRMVKALRSAGVPCEAHLFEEGGHGFGLGPTNGPASQWPSMFDRWLQRTFSGAASDSARGPEG